MAAAAEREWDEDFLVCALSAIAVSKGYGWCLFQPASTGDFIRERDKAIFLFLLNTGTRARELCNLNIKEIDLNTGSAMIRYGKGGKTRMLFIGCKI